MRGRVSAGLLAGLTWVSWGAAIGHPDEYLNAVRRVRPSVVVIQVDKGTRVVDGRTVPAGGVGTGVIVDRNGTIVTNAHVIEGAVALHVVLEDRREFDAEAVGSDAATDVGVIKIPGGRDLPVATLGDSNSLEVGQKVVAVGNPMGLGFTVTTGIVSAVNRSTGSTEYRNFIQTDAAINPGNSGGPLADLEGRVVGINTFIVGARAGSEAQSAGLGFAIPINMVRTVMESIVEGGVSSRAYLGLTLTDVTQEIARESALRRIGGCRVDAVIPGGPAEESGVRAGDVILQVDDVPVENAQHLRAILLEHGVGAQVDLQVARRDAPTAVVRTRIGADPGGVARTYGLRFDEMPGGPVVVTEVAADSPAAAAGLQPGDRIEAVDNSPVPSLRDLARVLSRLDVARDRPRLRGRRPEGDRERPIYAVLDATAN